MDQEDQINSLDIEAVKRRSVSGIVALISRTFVIQIISFIATLALTIFLDPAIYGVFYLVSSVVNFLTYFSDIGLAAALIQKKEKIEKEDLATTFTLQQSLVILLLLILFVLRKNIVSFYHLDRAGEYLLYAMAISFFLSSLKTIPTILLERQIQFNKLIIPQIAETLIFNLVAVFFAWKGFGVNAFSFAVLARGLTGLTLIYLIAPWRPSLGISKKSLSRLLRFGLPYQANTFLALFKDDGMTLILTKIIGTTGLGYIGWASRWANLPLRTFMDNVSKVAFPAFSRLQQHPDKLAKAVESSLKYLCLLVFPILVGMGFMADPVIHIIPRYTKWLPAVFALYLYLYNAAWACISSSLTNALNAVGRIKTTFKLMIMWTGMTWIFMPILAYKYQFNGVAIATALIGTSSVITIIAAKKYIKFSLIKSIKTPLIACLSIAAYLAVATSFVTSLVNLIIISSFAVLIYFATVYLIDGRQFFVEGAKIFRLRHE